MPVKYVFVTGGVVSGLGKGITAAALGRLLKDRGLRVTLQKFDPYLNVDPGTMSPYQHGEVFVTDDGHECDLDLGHYERFVDENLGAGNNISQGLIYWTLLNRERDGDFLGGTVQVIPHVTNEIKSKIYRVGRVNTDVVIAEIGGTVGDIESQPFIEAIRQVAVEVGRENVLFIHVSLIVSASGEPKSKPTQHSVKELLSMGIQPDVVVCRTEEPLTAEIRQKLALFCNVPADCIIQNATAETLYEVPLLLHNEGLDMVVCRRLGLDAPPPNISDWAAMVDRIKSCDKQVTIALVGKYVSLQDAYLSVAESLRHAGVEHGAKVDIRWINSEDLDDQNAAQLLDGADGIIVPGGFGGRGIEGKIAAVRYARERKVPFMGICLGLHMAIIELARSVCGWQDANSFEFDEASEHCVIDFLPEQRDIDRKGGTMRLGLYACRLVPDTIAARVYDAGEVIYERHRHRYEVNEEFLDALKEAGLVVSGASPDGRLVEIVELRDHPYFIATQFHPEFKSRPGKPHPIFDGLIAASLQ
ncbi:CTP synthetase [Clostridia bacterium]|nr:CTP synthetase [Clostridia bacterium]